MSDIRTWFRKERSDETEVTAGASVPEGLEWAFHNMFFWVCDDRDGNEYDNFDSWEEAKDFAKDLVSE